MSAQNSSFAFFLSALRERSHFIGARMATFEAVAQSIPAVALMPGYVALGKILNGDDNVRHGGPEMEA